MEHIPVPGGVATSIRQRVFAPGCRFRLGLGTSSAPSGHLLQGKVDPGESHETEEVPSTRKDDV
jgi:hypothetical protein